MKIRTLFVRATAALALLTSSVVAAGDAGAGLFQQGWHWKDEHDKAVSFADWKGQPLIIGLAYTSCKRTCPMTILKLKQTLSELQGKAEVVFVTIDPTIDTPDKLARFKAEWKLPEARWHFLTGNPEQTQNLAKWLGIHYQAINEHFIHDAKIVVTDGSGRIVRTIEGWDSISADALGD